MVALIWLPVESVCIAAGVKEEVCVLAVTLVFLCYGWVYREMGNCLIGYKVGK